ncbi:MAG: DUF1631 family protein, partial [Lysobacter sp.]
MPVPSDPFASPRQRSTSLATAPLPRRVREVLEALYVMVADELARHLERMLVDFELQLFRLADESRNQRVQGKHFETLRIVRQNRADLVPQFLIGLEKSLSEIREPAVRSGVVTTDLAPVFHNLRLIDHDEASAATMLRSMAVRQESRASLQLQLLGQRFGVLAGAPAFDAERLPVGPFQLAQLVQQASEVLKVGPETRQELLRTFDRHVLGSYEQLIEMMNALLARHNVLPGLSFVPLRARPRAQQHSDRRDAAPSGGVVPAQGDDGDSQPHTGWMGEVPESDPAAETAAFDLLQELLAERRNLLTKLRPAKTIQPNARPPLPTPDVLDALGQLQSAKTVPHSVTEVRQALLLKGWQKGGEPIALSREDSDTFELLDLLYTEIGREVRDGTASTALMEKLQVPLLRVALQDREFFVRQQHPARQLLNAVAESGARWLADDDADPQLGTQLRQAVDHVVANYDGDANVFEAANHALQEKLQAMARKAEVTERRHVDAARGKERLVLAKQRSAAVLDEAVRGTQLPRFLHTLLSQAWADVLTLTLLRHGED